MLLMCWTQYVRKFGKFSNGHRTGKGQLSFQSQRKVMPKNVQTTVHHIPLPHTENFQVFWNLEKAEEPEVKLPTSVGSKERQRHSWKTSTSAALTAINPLTTRCGKFLKRWEYQTTLPGSWETCMQIKKKRLEWDMEQWFQIGKGVHWGCILSPCLFKLYPPPKKKIICQIHHAKCWAGGITSWKQGFWEKYQQHQIWGWYHFNDRKWRGTKSILRVAKEESEKIGLKLNVEKTNMTSGPIPLW